MNIISSHQHNYPMALPPLPVDCGFNKGEEGNKNLIRDS